MQRHTNRRRWWRTAAAVASASALAAGLPSAPAQAAEWKSAKEIPFPAGANHLTVVSTGDGDAVAAAVIGGAVWAATAVDGTWTAKKRVAYNFNASDLALASNDKGEVALAWTETGTRLMVSRQVAPAEWTEPQRVNPEGTSVGFDGGDIGIADNGLVVTAVAVKEGQVDGKVLLTEWPKSQPAPSAPKVLAAGGAGRPALDVNAKGEALVSFLADGLGSNVLRVFRRTPGQGWNQGVDAATTHTYVLADQDVAISDNGQGQVIYPVAGPGDVPDVAYTSRVLPGGTVMPGQAVGPLDHDLHQASVDMDADGSALFTWLSRDSNDDATVRVAYAPNQESPTTSQTLGATPEWNDAPEARLSDGGVRVVQFNTTDGDQIVTYTREGGALQTYEPHYSGIGYGIANDVAVDDEGNAVVVAPRFFDDAAISWFYDGAGPAVAVNPMPVNLLTNPSQPGVTFPVSWTAADSLSALDDSDVYVTSAAWHEATFGEPELVASNVQGTTTAVPWQVGTTYCVQVQAFDVASNGSVSPERCTTVPLDDRGLLGEGWDLVNDQTAAFRNTLTSTTEQGLTLSRSAVKAKRLALVVRKAADGGSVKVTHGSQVLGTFSLVGTGSKQVVPLVTYPEVKGGAITIEVVSADGKQVQIDGLVVAKK